uniref:Uncharacterized protein n=1 Tax=Anguilla anguilla TaxID=7936 RepID=A0A0E9UCA6_ANGAN
MRTTLSFFCLRFQVGPSINGSLYSEVFCASVSCLKKWQGSLCIHGQDSGI